MEQLQEFDFKIVHQNGKSHSNVDALSRRPSEDLESSHIAVIDVTGPLAEKLKDIRDKQRRIAPLGQCWWQEKPMSSQKRMSLKNIQLEPISCFSSGSIGSEAWCTYFTASLLEQEVGVLVYD